LSEDDGDEGESSEGSVIGSDDGSRCHSPEQTSENSRHTRIRFMRREKESECGAEVRGFGETGEVGASSASSEEQYDEHIDSCSSSWSSIFSSSPKDEEEDEDEEYGEDAAELEFMTDDILLGGGGATSTSWMTVCCW